MTDLIQILQFIWQAMLHALPFFVVSIFLSVLVRMLKLEGSIKRVFERHVLVAIVLATAVGAFSPFCSCTVIPIIAGLIASGVPLAPIMAFWIASPTMDPEIFVLSVGILGWPLAITRLIATLALSLGAGYITLLVTKTAWLKGRSYAKQLEPTLETAVACCTPQESAPAAAMPTFQPINTGAISLQMASNSQQTIPLDMLVTEPSSCGDEGCSTPLPESDLSIFAQARKNVSEINPNQFGREMLKDSWFIGKWLLVAFLLEALITLYVPQTAVAALLGTQSRFAVPLAALIGVPLYLTNITALPIVSGLLAQGMQAGAGIAFLISGPVTTMPAMTAVYGVVHKRIFILYLAIGLGGAILLGLLTNLFM